jgi:DNA-binding NtrC family response regulator
VALEGLTALVADDEPGVLELAADALRPEGLRVVTATDGRRAFDVFVAERPDVAVLDLEMPGLGGIDVLERIKAMAPDVPVIMFTAYGDIPRAVHAIKLGAWDFLSKPLEIVDFVATVRRALERAAVATPTDPSALGALMGESAVIRSVIEQVQRVAPSALSVVVCGETGTGKELVARAIHARSERARGPLVALDCGAIPETLIESELFGYERGAFTGADRRRDGYFHHAQGGTLFLDEIGNLPLPTQAKLLRALQERTIRPLGSVRSVPIDVRVIAATNAPLEREVRAGRFREDLYYRLGEFTILLPPLRERRSDVPHLAERFLGEAARELGRPARRFTEEAVAALMRHDWPGNVRQLRNVVRRAVVVAGEEVRLEHLGFGEAAPAASTETGAGDDGVRPLREVTSLVVAAAEREAITAALRATHGNKSEAARLLDTDYKTLHLKMKRYRIVGTDFR